MGLRKKTNVDTEEREAAQRMRQEVGNWMDRRKMNARELLNYLKKERMTEGRLHDETKEKKEGLKRGKEEDVDRMHRKCVGLFGHKSKKYGE